MDALKKDMNKTFMYFFIYLVCLLYDSAFANSMYFIPKAQKFDGMITSRGKAQKNEESGMMEVYVRGCGKISIPKNASGEVPKDGENIELAFSGRCSIVDWGK